MLNQTETDFKQEKKKDCYCIFKRYLVLYCEEYTPYQYVWIILTKAHIYFAALINMNVVSQKRKPNVQNWNK